MASPKRAVTALWLSAAVIAALGTAILYPALPGVNWGIWTTLAVAGLFGTLRAAKRPIESAVAIPALMAVALAWSAMLTSSGFFHFWVLVVMSVLLALSIFLAAGLPVYLVGAARIGSAPLAAAALAAVEAGRRVGEAIGLLRGGEPTRLLRGTLLALPILTVFALLLSGADPLFAAARRETWRVIESLAFVDRLIVFGVLGTATLGGYGLALRGDRGLLAVPAAPMSTPLFGDIERVIVLGSVASLFGIFLVLQVAYLFGNPGAAVGSGVTYAEYARRGFAELTVAATLCAGMLVALERWKSPGRRERLTLVLSLILILALYLLLLSALRRVHLYEAAYGHTTDRLYAQIYIFGIAAALILLASELWIGLDARRYARRTAVVAFTAFLGLTVWNHEGWIAQRNLERAARTGNVDVRYLAFGLSLDAAPAIVSGLPALEPAQREELMRALHRAHHDADALQPRRWWEWNLRRTDGVRALVGAGVAIDQPVPREPREHAAQR